MPYFFQKHATTDVGARLFHFRYGPADARPDPSPFDQRQDMAIVKVDIRDDNHSADLVSALSARMAHSEIPSKQQVIFEPSDVVTFQLVRHDILPSYSRTPSLPRQPFRYPKYIYLDQYMKENVEISSAKWRQQKEIAEKIQNLTLRENTLKRHQAGISVFRVFSSAELTGSHIRTWTFSSLSKLHCIIMSTWQTRKPRSVQPQLSRRFKS